MSANLLVDLANGVHNKAAFVAQALTQTTTSSAIDMSTDIEPVAALLNLGAVAGTNPTLDVKFQESTLTNSGFADISGASFAQQTTTGTDVLAIRFLRTKRYLRSIATVGGTGNPSFTAGVTVHQQKRTTGTGGGASISPQV